MNWDFENLRYFRQFSPGAYYSQESIICRGALAASRQRSRIWKLATCVLNFSRAPVRGGFFRMSPTRALAPRCSGAVFLRVPKSFKGVQSFA